MGQLQPLLRYGPSLRRQPPLRSGRSWPLLCANEFGSQLNSICVSLRIADPPAISRLYIHRLDEDQPWPNASDLHHAEVVAAHHGSILFWTHVPFDDPDFVAPGHFPVDYFVYTASSSSPARPPSLTRLPPCFIDGFSDPVEDNYYKPYQQQGQRIMLDENIGFLSYSGDGEFMVADIRSYGGYSLELCILNHRSPSPSPSPEQWRIQRLEMNHVSARKIGPHKLCKWVNDVVLTLHGRYLCCVDFFKGILLIDTSNLQSFSYIPLSKEAMVHGHRIDEDDPDPARRVSVTGTGSITLVCIDSVVVRGKTRDFTIKSWSLVDIHDRRWLHNFTMGADEFWNLCAEEESHRLPRRAPPSFPVVSLVDPHAISFLLKDDDKDLYWIVEIDMRKKALRSPAVLYINAEEEEEECCGEDWKSFCGHYFIPSWFTSYLHEDPIQSRKRSETMQKAKQESTMHKVGWIERKQRMETLRQEREKQESEMLENIDWKLMAIDQMIILRSLQLNH